ncbi:hypothetical protein [endosymbiont 'TC1' of Trimyema compressum]|nr:hypothetical protein [endosymbiont 'TC1' of Trimyema compressum]
MNRLGEFSYFKSRELLKNLRHGLITILKLVKWIDLFFVVLFLVANIVG